MRKIAEQFAKVLAAIERQKSANAIKTELGISPGITAKVAAAWQQEHRALTAVG